MHVEEELYGEAFMKAKNKERRNVLLSRPNKNKAAPVNSLCTPSLGLG